MSLSSTNTPAVVASEFSIAAQLKAILEEQENDLIQDDLFEEHAQVDENQDFEDDFFFNDDPLTTTPETTPPSSPLPTTTPLPNIAEAGPSVVDSSSNQKRKAKGKLKSKENRKKKRKLKATAEEGQYIAPKARRKANDLYRDKASPIYTATKAAAANVTSTGYIAKNVRGINVNSPGYKGTEKMKTEKRVYTLQELIGDGSIFGFKLIRWDGKTPMPIVDIDGLLMGVCAGQPNHLKWKEEHERGAELLDKARQTASKTSGDQTPRRGDFKTMRTGVSHGGGQTQPQNLKNTGRNLKTIERLNSDRFFRNLASFTSSVFEHWAPSLHSHYETELGKLFKHDPTLRATFKTVFTATTYNLGPQTACFPHIDFANLAFGWCSVTALGNYDPTKGGHLILWECGLVIEFPPGSTILLASALLHHSNTPVQKGETRFSFTQYSAGALFRWVDHDFMTTAKHRNSLSAANLAKLEQRNANRWLYGLSLTPRLPAASTRPI